MTAFTVTPLSSLWDIFLLFTIPVGGGIPAGVLMAQTRNVGWVDMVAVYLLSDILLAFLFEPLMKFFIWSCQHSKFLAHVRESFKKSTGKLVAGYGAAPGPFALVLIAFGVDPMTGRAAAQAAGHGFLAGWTIAIMGDMLFFGVVAVSTICLNNFLGDGTWTAIIIMVAMLGFPALIRRFKNQK
ncbi:MAG: hypothetical protein H7235_05660 [Bdellovibrionaceae bacterium]|nr:hypothetical protein [Pseudobdellovibrionaceae bacterium]